SACTYSSKAFIPFLVILHVVRGFLPRKVFSTAMYPASESLSNCTLRLPALAFVFSFRKVNSAESTLISIDMMARRNWEWSSGSRSLNIAIVFFLQHISGYQVSTNNGQCTNQWL